MRPESRGWQEEVTETSKHSGAYMKTWICGLRTVGRHGVLSIRKSTKPAQERTEEWDGYGDTGKLVQFQKAGWVGCWWTGQAEGGGQRTQIQEVQGWVWQQAGPGVAFDL